MPELKDDAIRADPAAQADEQSREWFAKGFEAAARHSRQR